MPWALVFAFASAGSSNAARIAMIAMTTNSSMSVKPLRSKTRDRARMPRPNRSAASNGTAVRRFARPIWIGNTGSIPPGFPMGLIVIIPAFARLRRSPQPVSLLRPFDMAIAEDDIRSAIVASSRAHEFELVELERRIRMYLRRGHDTREVALFHVWPDFV